MQEGRNTASFAQSEVNKANKRRPMVRYTHVKKTFGETEVLKGVNLEVATGEKVAIIGPSGSGKTTLIRMLMTLEQPTSGTIEVDGERLWHRPADGKPAPANEKHLRAMRSKIGMVFQQYNLFPHMTVQHNITAALTRVLGLSKQEAQKRAFDMLEKVGLADKATCYPRQLSGGQQQRVAIARAVVLQPKVMLFDEVTSALDPELVGEVLAVIKDLAASSQMTMLLVTHEMDFAIEVADRIIFVDGGHIVEQGAPRNLIENPKTERLQSFLGRFRSSYASPAFQIV